MWFVLSRAVWGHCFEVLQVSTPTWMLMPRILFLSENQSTLQTFMIFCTQFLDKSHLVTNQQGVLLLSWFHSNTGFQIMCDLWFRRDSSNSNFVTGLESDICDDMLYNTKVRSSNKWERVLYHRCGSLLQTHYPSITRDSIFFLPSGPV